MITTGTLAGARLNIEFEAALQATGGDGGPYTFEFGNEGLSPTLGVVLESDGRFHGAPSATGTFEFDVVATDGNSSDTKRLTLSVSRSRWLVYESDEQALGTYHLYAADVTTDPPNKVRLPYEVPRTHVSRYPRFAFSPDGRYLAYVANYDPWLQNPVVPRVFVVDMTGERPGDSVHVSGMYSNQSPVIELAWSPDSRGLAFAVGSGGVTPFRIFYAALSDLTTTREVGDVVGPDEWNAFGWVGPNVLTYSTFRSLAYTRPFTNVQGQPFEQLFYGRIQQAWPELETALVMSIAEDECLDGTWNLVDFRQGSLVPREFIRGNVIGSPRLEYLAYRHPDTKRYDIYRAWQTRSIASFKSGSTLDHGCSPGAWSRDETMFVACGDDARLVVMSIANDVGTPTVIAGDYGEMSERQPPAFSPNDEWLAFSTNVGVFVAKKAEGAVSAPYRVDPASLPTAKGNEPHIRFSPDSSAIAYAEQPSVADRPARAFVARLGAGHPEGSALDLGFEKGSGIFRVEWSPHSTELAFGAKRSSERVPWEIYLARDTPQGFAVTKLNGPMAPCSGTYDTCQLVTTFVFQP